jgi:hypothetical protein
MMPFWHNCFLDIPIARVIDHGHTAAECFIGFVGCISHSGLLVVQVVSHMRLSTKPTGGGVGVGAGGQASAIRLGGLVQAGWQFTPCLM